MKKRDATYITVCIPAYKELQLLEMLNSLAVCMVDGLIVKVLIFINAAENEVTEVKMLSEKVFIVTKEWIAAYDGNISFECFIDQELPPKHAGVGLARRVLGDKAATDFKSKNINGVIVYLDADCTVERNYLQAISHFFGSTNFNAAAIHFEHPIEDEIRDKAIIEYELHLRYYILMQRFLALPFAIHTVGSSMACLSDAYLKKGGMNKRKAGEDFYFLQKFIKDDECGHIHNTTVYPSGRISERVPFGTGRAMLKYEEEGFEWQTYNPEAFLILKPFLDKKVRFYDFEIDFSGIHEGLKAYLESINAKEKIALIKGNVASFEAFEKRFFQFFDAFQLMKYLHFMRDEYGVNDVPITEGVAWYFEKVIGSKLESDLSIVLSKIREIDNK